MTLFKVESIARIVREELQGFALKYFPSNWAGSCLVCSSVLNKVLKQKKFKSEVVIGDYINKCHAFVIYRNKFVVDITGTQFSLPDVVVTNLKDSNYKPFFYSENVNQHMVFWPEEQRPQTYTKELNLIYNSVLARL